MLCNHCGKEFGEGITCQFCGTDRVEALGTFGGFHPNSKGSGSMKQGITTPGGISVTNSDKMLCFCCGEIIPGVAKFCPYCKAEQYVVCPKCGIRYLAQYPSCYDCGTEREKYLKSQETASILYSLQQRKEAEDRKIQEEEQRRQRIEDLRIQAEEERRLKEFEEARREREQRLREEEEKQKKIKEESYKKEQRKRDAEARALLQKNELEWFRDYLHNHKDELLIQQIRLNKSRERKEKGKHRKTSILILFLSMLVCWAVFLGFEATPGIAAVAFGSFVVVNTISVVSANIIEKRPTSYYTLESYLLRKYSEAHNGMISYTYRYQITEMLNDILGK